ncbi:MAG: amidohydrolase, partial [Ruminococcus sp.]|nr:amidohydrolase [Ruminococcus sp.]
MPLENSRQIYFKNGYILTMNASNQVYACGSLLVEGDKILAVGEVDERQLCRDAEV